MNYSYSSSNNAAMMSPIFWLIEIVIIVFYIVCQWKIFTKAGQPGWASIIPIYSFLVLLKIIGKPWWWILLLFVPFANIVIIIMTYAGLSKVFGRSTVFTIFGLILFSFVGYPMLAFGSSKYTSPTNVTPAPTTPSQPVTPTPVPTVPPVTT